MVTAEPSKPCIPGGFTTTHMLAVRGRCRRRNLTPAAQTANADWQRDEGCREKPAGVLPAPGT